jgi:DNA invertase Pin-like site-specific DNA recombinase
MKRPHAYLRKSVVEKNKRLLSPEVQEAEVRKIAERHGDDELVVLSDIGRSGKNTKRPGYRELVGAIAAGHVSALYAYSLSRLNRSVADYADLVALCVEHGVPIRLVHEGEQDFSTPAGRFTSTILAAAAQMQRELDSERQKDNIRAKRAKGEHHGARAYGHYDGEDPQKVMDAFAVTGSINGAARLLDEWGVPSRGGKPWAPSSVRRVIHYRDPSVLPAGQVARVKSAPDFRLARLLKCHCGRILSAANVRDEVRYRCKNSINATHGKASIGEGRVIDRIQELWADFDHAGLRLEAEEHDAERSKLYDRIDKLSRQHEMGLLDDAQIKERVDEVRAALDRVETRSVAADLPDHIDWQDDDPRAVNAVLRAAWDHVELDEDLRPVRAAWRF